MTEITRTEELGDSRASYENFEGRCPHCDSWNIFNRVSDLKTVRPIAGMEAQCQNEACGKPVWLTDDWVNPAFEMFLFQSESFCRKKQYTLSVLTAVQACEVFFAAVVYTWLLYRPFPNQREDLNLFNELVRRLYKKIGRYSFPRMQEMLLHVVLEDLRPKNLDEARKIIEALPRVLPRAQHFDITGRTSGRLMENLLVLRETKIYQRRNLVVHMHAYRPSEGEARSVLEEARRIIYPLKNDLGPELEFEDYANAPPG